VKVSTSNPAALKKPSAVTSLPQKKVVPQSSTTGGGGQQLKGSTTSKVSKSVLTIPLYSLVLKFLCLTLTPANRIGVKQAPPKVRMLVSESIIMNEDPSVSF
jgi:hypothetical protein